jgi:hypothetical protein
MRQKDHSRQPGHQGARNQFAKEEADQDGVGDMYEPLKKMEEKKAQQQAQQAAAEQQASAKSKPDLDEVG